MRIYLKTLIFSLLFLVSIFLTNSALWCGTVEFSGILTEARQKYIVLDGLKYKVTKDTVIVYTIQPNEEIPYDPGEFSSCKRRLCRAKIIVDTKDNTVKKIIVEATQ